MAILQGTPGDDALDGQGGEQTLIGGEGNDRYRIDSTGDQIIEQGPTLALTLASRTALQATAIGSNGVNAMSGDGRVVAFSAAASALSVSSPNRFDLMTRDLTEGGTRIAAQRADGVPIAAAMPSLSFDGTHLAFQASLAQASPTTLVQGVQAQFYTGPSTVLTGIFVRHAGSGAVVPVSTSAGGDWQDGPSASPDLSADGRYVVFSSSASNLAPGEVPPGYDSIYWKDVQTGAIARVSQGAASVAGDNNSTNPSISGDGRVVAFQSFATNLVAGDTNETFDIFVWRRDTDSVTRVSTDSAGVAPGVTAFGARVPNASTRPDISADGRYVAFVSGAATLVVGDTNNAFDVFRKDLQTGETRRVSVAADGTQGNGDSQTNDENSVAISGDGRFVAFSSAASNLVAGDTNGVADTFLKDMLTGQIVRLSQSSAGVSGNGPAAGVAISDDGRVITFTTRAGNLLAGDTNNANDVYAIGNPFLNGGLDVATTTVSFTLPAHVETLEALGSGIDGIGNSADNRLVNLGLGNRLVGAAGTDTGVFAGTRAGHQVERAGTRFIVTSQDGARSAALESVEQLAFDDKSFSLVAPPATSTPEYGKTSTFLFDPVYYLLANPDLVPSVTVATANQHFFGGAGPAQGRRPNAWFDASFYEQRWPDLAAAGLDDTTLFLHYNLYGVWEGRSANRALNGFNGERYLAENPDVAGYVDANLDAFLGSRTNGAIAHFVIYGEREGRLAFETDGTPIDFGYLV